MEPRLTSRQLAAKLGIAQSTVSMALSGHSSISKKTRKKVLDAARKHGYTPNLVARAMRMGSSKLIGFIGPDIGLTYFSEILHAVEKTARAQGFNCLIAQNHSTPEIMESVLQTLLGQRVDGLVIIPLNEVEQTSLYQDLTARGVNFVLVDNEIKGVAASYISSDNLACGRLAAEHLLTLGHTRIAWLRGYPHATTARLREEGFRTAFADAGLQPDERLIVDSNFGFSAGEASMQKLLESGVKFSAVATAADTTAAGAMRALKAAGLRIPDDISVVGCSNLEFSSLITPPLTTIDQNTMEIGRRAAETLIAMTTVKHQAPTRILVTPTLLARESTAPLAVPLRQTK